MKYNINSSIPVSSCYINMGSSDDLEAYLWSNSQLDILEVIYTMSSALALSNYWWLDCG